MILNTRRRDSLSVIIMKRKINIINALLFIVTFFFGCLFFANLVHFITNPEISNTSRQGKNLRLHGYERQTHPKLLRAAKSAKLRVDTGPQPFEGEFLYEDGEKTSEYQRGEAIDLQLVENSNTGTSYGFAARSSNSYSASPPPFRVVHLDLKGAPPKLSYLREIFPLIWKAGGNALLIEYEDMFPYSGPIVNASALNAFSRTQVLELISLAKNNHLEIIPLVQTFGHMEHVLKLEEFSHLREMEQYPQSICPSNEKSFDVIKMMIDQIMELHADSKYIHIGCDEVFQLGMCSSCKERMRGIRSLLNNKHGDDYIDGGAHTNLDSKKKHQHNNNNQATSHTASENHELYLNHVKRVGSYVNEASNERVRAIIWDDMLRSISFEQILQSNIAKYVEPMVWVYVEDVDHFVDGETWKKYSNLFSHIWVASAFKGAFGERLFIPNVLRHYHNHISWLNVMKRESISTTCHGRPISFRGIALTGWSRYDHFAVLCELLPVSIPSLVLNLISVSSPLRTNVSTKFNVAERLLKCPKGSTSGLAVIASKAITASSVSNSITETALENDPHQFELRRCKFPGSNIYGAVGSLAHYKSEVEALDTTSRETQGWLTSYNIRHNYSSPWRLSETIGGHTYLVKALEDYKNRTSQCLKSVFERPTVSSKALILLLINIDIGQ